MSRFLSPRYSDMLPYTPGEQPRDKQYIKLNTNESPYPPSPRAIAAVNAGEIADLRLYSDPTVGALTTEIAKFYGVRENQVFVGNGSDEILAFLFLAFCDRERGIAFPDISYGFYPVYARLFEVDARKVPLREDFSIDIEDYKGMDRPILIANPNAPTGLCLSVAEIEQLLLNNPDQLVVIDEAYVDFGGESCIPLLDTYSNLMVIHTFSKSRSMAGMRLGYALAAPDVIEDLGKMKFSFNPYNVDRLAIVAGAAAMGDREHFEQCCGKVIKTRENAMEQFRGMGFTVLQSKANFIFMSHPDISGADYTKKLRENGVLVRYFPQPRIDNYVRMSIGTDEEMENVFAITRKILSEV